MSTGILERRETERHVGRHLPAEQRPRKINDCFREMKRRKTPDPLFDNFWRAGEIALMFGAQGCGKTLLAVQIAEGLASGCAIEGFEMPRRGRRVLYVDLKQTDMQFAVRYAEEGKRRYRFSGNLYRDRPPEGGELAAWLREKIEGDGYEAVIIDDVSAVKATFEGTRETVRLMRELKAIRNERGTSIMVLAETMREPREREGPSETDLGRTRILCTYADTVIGLKSGSGEHRPGRIALMRASNLEPGKLDRQRCPFSIERRENGFLGLEFWKVLDNALDKDQRERLKAIYAGRQEGKTFREIAAELGIGKTVTHRLYGRITKLLSDKFDREIESQKKEEQAAAARAEAAACSAEEEEDEDEFEEAGIERPEWLEFERSAGPECDDDIAADAPTSAAAEPEPRRTIADLEREYDHNWDEIYVEQRERPAGRPTVWYKQDRKGRLKRLERKFGAVYVEELGAWEGKR